MALEVLLILVFDVESEVHIRPTISLVCATGVSDRQVAAAGDETAIRLGDLRQEIRHSRVSTFTDELKQREIVFKSLIDKIKAVDAPSSDG